MLIPQAPTDRKTRRLKNPRRHLIGFFSTGAEHLYEDLPLFATVSKCTSPVVSNPHACVTLENRKTLFNRVDRLGMARVRRNQPGR